MKESVEVIPVGRLRRRLGGQERIWVKPGQTVDMLMAALEMDTRSVVVMVNSLPWLHPETFLTSKTSPQSTDRDDLNRLLHVPRPTSLQDGTSCTVPTAPKDMTGSDTVGTELAGNRGGYRACSSSQLAQ